MAGETRIASRYAKSLLEFGKEHGILEELHQDMVLLRNTCEQSRDFYLLLRSPVVHETKKKSVLHHIFDDKMHQVTLSLFDIVVHKHREKYLPLIAGIYDDMYLNYQGIDKATVATTFELDNNLRDKFKKAITNTTGRDVQLTEKVDKSLIGGYVLKLGDRQVDDSIKSKLNKITREFHKEYS